MHCDLPRAQDVNYRKQGESLIENRFTTNLRIDIEKRAYRHQLPYSSATRKPRSELLDYQHLSWDRLVVGLVCGLYPRQLLQLNNRVAQELEHKSRLVGAIAIERF